MLARQLFNSGNPIDSRASTLSVWIEIESWQETIVTHALWQTMNIKPFTVVSCNCTGVQQFQDYNNYIHFACNNINQRYQPFW